MNEAIFRMRSRSGSVMVMVAISLTALLGIAALVIDLGLLYVAKQNARNTADQCAVSALAAVNDYSDYSSENRQVGDEVTKVFGYAKNAYPSMTNGTDTRSATVAKFIGLGLSGWIYNTSTGTSSKWFQVNGEFQFNVSCQVTCKIPVDPTFSQVFNATQKTITANAVARLYSVPYLDYAFAPWAVRLSTIFPQSGTGTGIPVGDVNSFVTLTNPGGTVMNQDGFTAIALTDTYANRLQGLASSVKLSTALPAEPPATLVQPSYVSILATQANFNSTTGSALTARFGTDAGNDVSGKSAYLRWIGDGQNGSYPDSNRILIVPIVNDMAEGDGTYKVRGFAPVFVTSFDAALGRVRFVLISATWTGGKLRWSLKSKPGNTTSMVSKIALYDSDKTLTP